METASAGSSAPRLRRSLTLWDLILYGVIVIQPVAPMSVFGVLSNRGHGHVVTTILLAMVAMLFTAISYGRMARAYPSAGSAFTYVGREINPALGYVTGWSMVMDYMLNPMICIIWCSQAAHAFAPHVPYWIWAIFFAVVFTGLNIQGVKTSARLNAVLAVAMGVVIAIFFVAAGRYIFAASQGGAAFFMLAFYDPALWNLKAVISVTLSAVLTISVSTASLPFRRSGESTPHILLATVFTPVIGILSARSLCGPTGAAASQPFPTKTRRSVCRSALGAAFEWLASRCWWRTAGMGAQLGAARLLYGMGRSNALPKSFFGAVDPKWRVPRNNVIFVGAIALGGAFIVSYGLGAEMLNFGALIAFMGVNLAAFLRYFVRSTEKNIWTFVPPVGGFLICLLRG
jgi:amino acid transporter